MLSLGIMARRKQQSDVVGGVASRGARARKGPRVGSSGDAIAKALDVGFADVLAEEPPLLPASVPVAVDVAGVPDALPTDSPQAVDEHPSSLAGGLEGGRELVRVAGSGAPLGGELMGGSAGGLERAAGALTRPAKPRFSYALDPEVAGSLAGASEGPETLSVEVAPDQRFAGFDRDGMARLVGRVIELDGRWARCGVPELTGWSRGNPPKLLAPVRLDPVGPRARPSKEHEPVRQDADLQWARAQGQAVAFRLVAGEREIHVSPLAGNSGGIDGLKFHLTSHPSGARRDTTPPLASTAGRSDSGTPPLLDRD